MEEVMVNCGWTVSIFMGNGADGQNAQNHAPPRDTGRESS